MQSINAEYLHLIEQYRTLSLADLTEELHSLRLQMRNRQASVDMLQTLAQQFGIAWHVFEEKGGDLRRLFP